VRNTLVAISVCLLLGADKDAETAKKELAKLNGEWSMVSASRDGQALPEDMVKTAKRVAKDGEITVTFGEMVYMKAKVTIDPSKKPKTIDYAVTEGGNKGKTVLGIYELDGDTVKFCFGGPDKERPDDFTSKEGSGRVLSVWKRDKK
jgi:uncharacterized protein (TIGR03067 family)